MLTVLAPLRSASAAQASRLNIETVFPFYREITDFSSTYIIANNNEEIKSRVLILNISITSHLRPLNMTTFFHRLMKDKK